MKRILNFVRLDFYTIKSYWLPIMFMAAMSVAVGTMSNSPTMAAMIFMLAMAIFSTYPFTVSENNQLDILYATLPLNRNDVVQGRYAFALSLLSLVCIIFLTVGLMINLIFSAAASLGAMCFVILAAASLFLLLVSLYYPLCFKFGYNKARMYIIVPFILIYPLGTVVGFLIELLSFNFEISSAIKLLRQLPLALGLLAFAIGLLVMLVSYKVSCGFYERPGRG